MKDERNPRQHDEDRDPDVSRVYREIATERAPTTLNEMVLAHAARHGERAYPRWTPWLRPLAWAATIALSLAIVLELSETPQLDGGPADAQKTATESAVVPSAEEEPRSLRKSEAAPPDAEPAMAPRAEPEPPRRGADAFRPEAATVLEEAAGVARLRDSGTRQSENRAAAASAQPDAPACDEAARRTPESWLECIAALRESGQDAAAERELVALEEAFPHTERP